MRPPAGANGGSHITAAEQQFTNCYQSQHPDSGQLSLDLFPGEKWITDPRAHGEQLHAGGRGIVALGWKSGKERRFRQELYPVEVAIELANWWTDRADVYLSLQRFRHSRSIAQLLGCGALYADLDYYRSFPDLHPYMVLDLVLEKLAKAEIPPPTLAISSGRGLYVIWQHGNIPRAALPRWNRCQRELGEVLRDFRPDARARDAARVLRIVGTRHGATGRPVHSLLPVGDFYDFDALADAILPYSRAEILDLRIQRALRDSKTPQQRRHRSEQGFTLGTMQEGRLADYQRLRELRFFDGMMTDYRHRWLMFSAVAMGWLTSDAQAYQRELVELAKEAGDWPEGRTRADLGTVIRRTLAALRGEVRDHAGEKVDPRYRYSNQRIIEELEISADEGRHMRVIISEGEKRRRDLERKEEARREAEVLTRNQYLTRAAKRRVQARRLAANGLSVRKIAAAIGVSKSAVQVYLSGS